jgi:hypothetical protein
MTLTLGMLEWVENTKVIKDILQRELKEVLGKDKNLERENPGYEQR